MDENVRREYVIFVCTRTTNSDSFMTSYPWPPKPSMSFTKYRLTQNATYMIGIFEMLKYLRRKMISGSFLFLYEPGEIIGELSL